MTAIKCIKITNFRSITHLVIDCSTGMNFFIGNNGAGKSTVLDAVRILLSWFVARLRHPSGKGSVPSDQDITIGKGFCILAIELTNGVQWQIYKQRKTSRVQPVAKTELAGLTKYVNTMLGSSDPPTVPIMACYGVNRAVLDVPLRLNKHHKLEVLDAYENALDDGANYRSFFEWFREREDIENEQFSRNRLSNNAYKHDRQLQAVRDALAQALPEYGLFRVQRNPRAFILEKAGKKLDFRQLSDGEKCYITLIGDIARKLSMTHPTSDTPLLEDGIVLIDEVDLHLHPMWQSTVISRLRSCFPHCQFFITSHSAYVASNIKPTDLFMVLRENGQWLVTEAVYGAQSNELLTTYFDMSTLRNPDVQQHIDHIWKLMGQGDTMSTEFNECVNWLYANLPADDKELALIKFQKSLIEQGKIKVNGSR